MSSLAFNLNAILPIPKGLHPPAQGWLARAPGGGPTLGSCQKTPPTLKGLHHHSAAVHPSRQTRITSQLVLEPSDKIGRLKMTTLAGILTGGGTIEIKA
jgi:hypothetical protein